MWEWHTKNEPFIRSEIVFMCCLTDAFIAWFYESIALFVHPVLVRWLLLLFVNRRPIFLRWMNINILAWIATQTVYPAVKRQNQTAIWPFDWSATVWHILAIFDQTQQKTVTVDCVPVRISANKEKIAENCEL